ncbi:aminotransferase class V-fold PLP-dependent enzyme [Subsaximicrobium wynnwilliamsii]|uniref:Aminotransferase class V-fold PLP-dependent enzyme n=1 Tax=Subsaximicrobium wynnwilliamsii TaxID=291179 RepID=A0A5C6ZI12_9FLAO|nr:aminotransferase class V-fold PLP-dependent enzyme [Subsaximicrobium wynnwilliamsii]TXD83067.1 aminotransferase class V-fold PLP-dependent enzyme [Subsaximicrobium wynnwilliamsii]TXD88811.1 aminotransferase class V-fold PLP-dependent enzyme [Subsaximicrobium wynnwilliamsii]TXE02884.1 aminotransferase class V-fold PLP-dependent enzyme [Subsaximicrobium wynnwilliamsii]
MIPDKETSHTLQLSKDEMKQYGYQVIDAIVDHFDTERSKKPVALASREEMDTLFNREVPEDPTDFQTVFDLVTQKVLPNSNIVTHPKSYSFVPGPSNYVSVMADTLATGFNVFSGGWAGSPAAAELEIVTMNWLLKLFKFPKKKGGGIFTSGGSMANLTALVTARGQKLGDDFSKAVIYMSDQAHSSNIKAIRVLGFKKEQVRIIPTDMEFKMAINKLKSAIAIDKLEGLEPFCIIASAGTTNTGTVDPLLEIAKICKSEDLWYHIDGAYGGAAILSEKGKQELKGIEKADSLTIDPHKWMFQPYEMGCLLVRNHKWLSETFSEKPEYLRDIEGNTSEINFYDHGIQLTRRFRALKFYMSVKTFGLNAFKRAVSYNIEITERVEDLLRTSAKWEVISPATLAVINFRYNPLGKNYSEKELDRINQQISEKVVASREALLVTTVLQNQVVLRMCLINPRTTMEDIKETINLCESFAEDL